MIAMVVLGLAYPQSALACGGASAASSHFSLGLFLCCDEAALLLLLTFSLLFTQQTGWRFESNESKENSFINTVLTTYIRHVFS